MSTSPISRLFGKKNIITPGTTDLSKDSKQAPLNMKRSSVLPTGTLFDQRKDSNASTVSSDIQPYSVISLGTAVPLPGSERPWEKGMPLTGDNNICRYGQLNNEHIFFDLDNEENIDFGFLQNEHTQDIAYEALAQLILKRNAWLIEQLIEHRGKSLTLFDHMDSPEKRHEFNHQHRTLTNLETAYANSCLDCCNKIASDYSMQLKGSSLPEMVEEVSAFLNSKWLPLLGWQRGEQSQLLSTSYKAFELARKNLHDFLVQEEVLFACLDQAPKGSLDNTLLYLIHELGWQNCHLHIWSPLPYKSGNTDTTMLVDEVSYTSASSGKVIHLIHSNNPLKKYDFAHLKIIPPALVIKQGPAKAYNQEKAILR